MKFNNIIRSAAALALLLSFNSCNDYLDTMPDNRASIDTEEKIQKILVSAYPEISYLLLSETMSDNADDIGETNPYTSRFYDQMFNWQDITEDETDGPKSFYESCYAAISNANSALKALEEQGELTTTLREAKGEALVCRAYNHFMLVNMFSMPYNPATAGSDMGMPYMETVESTLRPSYSRGTVAETYAKIDQDLQEGLPLVGDTYYSQPKYHFNQKAAYAFAARFYLYYQKWDKAVEYATRCLGSAPQSILRNWAYLETLSKNINGSTYPLANEFSKSSAENNFIVCTAYSAAPWIIGPYAANGTRYAHDQYTADTEDVRATQIWDALDGSSKFTAAVFKASNVDKTLIPRIPPYFEYTDPVAGIGYRHTLLPLFTADETLLTRAEAYIMLKQYDKALADMNIWMHNFATVDYDLTVDVVSEFYNSVDYSYDDDAHMVGTVKKHLHPSWTIDEEDSEQESMLQCVLGMRRIETLHMGLRWFDVRRYGIVIPRRVLGADGSPSKVTDWLQTNDKRYAVQLPIDVQENAGFPQGLTPNPRN